MHNHDPINESIVDDVYQDGSAQAFTSSVQELYLPNGTQPIHPKYYPRTHRHRPIDAFVITGATLQNPEKY